MDKEMNTGDTTVNTFTEMHKTSQYEVPFFLRRRSEHNKLQHLKI